MDSSSSEEIIQKKFNNSSLKDILSISFQIKSSYKNINKLSKGEIIRSSKYRKKLENLIKNNKIFKDTEFKTIVSKYTEKSKKHKNKDGNYKRSSTDKNQRTNKSNKISLIQSSKFKFTSNNLDNYFNDKKIKSSFKKIDVNLDGNKKNEIKTNLVYESEKNEKNNIIGNNKVNSFIENIADKKLINIKNLEINKSKSIQNNNNNNNNSTLNNNKSYMSSLNFFNELDKDTIIKSENKLEILNNKNQNYINTNDNNIEMQKDNYNGNKCIVF